MTTTLETISKDLDWRESEIAGMRILLSSPAISEGQRKGLLRAAWAMLYAHYEGFCKESLTVFYSAICASGAACSELPQPTKLHALEKKMGHLRQMTSNELLEAILSFNSCHLEKSPSFPDVDTKSNLWPNVLIDLLESADLSPGKVAEHQLKLKTLVSRRNEIAHGKNNFITDVPYYLTFENAVYDVMYDLALQIDNRLRMPPYSAS